MFKCDKCLKEYKKELFYNKHVLTHENETARLTCKYCTKLFSFIQSRWKHEKNCKVKNKDETNELKDQINELKKQIADLMNERYKMHPKKFQKMKNNIEVNNGTINETINENINKGTINNINIIALGNENLEKVFSEAEQISILNKKNNALNYIIEYVHFNDKYPQFQNIVITNNRTNTAYLFDKDTKTFKLVNKDELIEILIDYRVCDIEDFFIAHENKLDENTKIIIKKITEERGDDEETMNDVKLLIFNNRSKVKHLLNK